MSAGPAGQSQDDDAERKEADLRLFIGPNAEKYIRHHRLEVENQRAVHLVNWPSLIGNLPWLFYRKLYSLGLFLFITPLVIAISIMSFSIPFAFFFLIFFSICSTSCYLFCAKDRIRRINALGLDDAARRQRLQDAGGTSPIGAVVGGLIAIPILTTAFIPRGNWTPLFEVFGLEFMKFIPA